MKLTVSDVHVRCLVSVYVAIIKHKNVILLIIMMLIGQLLHTPV